MNEYNLVKEKQEKNKAFPIIMFTLTIIVASVCAGAIFIALIILYLSTFFD